MSLHNIKKPLVKKLTRSILFWSWHRTASQHPPLGYEISIPPAQNDTGTQAWNQLIIRAELNTMSQHGSKLHWTWRNSKCCWRYISTSSCSHAKLMGRGGRFDGTKPAVCNCYHCVRLSSRQQIIYYFYSSLFQSPLALNKGLKHSCHPLSFAVTK